MQPIDDRPIRGEVRLVDFRRVSHGLFRRIRTDLSPAEEFLRDLAAWRLVLPEGAVFTHLTAARLMGWWMPAVPEQIPIFAAVRCDRHPRRQGLICSRLTHESETRTVQGMPVDAPEEILLRCARDLGVLDLVIMVDSARRHGDIDPARMKVILDSKRPGVARLRAAWELSNPRCESPGEGVLRVFHDVMGVPVDPQVDIFDAEGHFLARADLVVRGTKRLHEYDGAHHRDGTAHRRDLRRDRGLTGGGYVRQGYTLDDLLNHPAALMHELDRLLGRPHQLSRLARWRTLVDESLYSETGRQRIMNRWRRAMGVVEWSGTAS